MKSTIKSQRGQVIRLIVITTILTLVVGQACICCNGPPPGTDTPTPTESTQPGKGDVGEVTADAQVKRGYARVWTGLVESEEAISLSELTDSEWQPFPTGSLITTDQSGEGWVQFKDCMLIYVFRESKLRKSACPKSNRTGGNVTCAEEGTSTFNNQCASQIIIQTPNMQVELNGTWLTISYLPDLQLSVVEVWEGSATVWPVLDVEDYDNTLGDATEVGTGKSWFTAPVEVLEEIGLPQPTPMDGLPPQLEELLQPWREQVIARAQENDVVPPPPPEPAAIESFEVFLMSGGGPLDDPRVREAVRLVVPWGEIAAQAFPNQDVPILMGSTERGVPVKPQIVELWEVADARGLDYDPELARQLLAEAGYPDGFVVWLLYPIGDGALGTMAEMVAGNLKEATINASLVELTLEEVQDGRGTTMAELTAAGDPVLWLGRR